MSKRIIIYCLTVLPALILAGVILLFYPYYLKPNYSKEIMDEAQKDSIQIANHLVVEHKTDIKNFFANESENFEDCIKQDIEIFNLWKVRLFNTDGVIVYSSKKKEVGNVNQKPYFSEIVAKGKVFSKIVQKKDFTASGSITPFDVVETYVPIMEDGKFIGAYEIYLNVTDQKNRIESLFYNTYVLYSIIIVLFLILVVCASITVDRSVHKLQLAREEIRTFQDILPICSSCKKIRDDKGFWKRVDHYIMEQTDTKFSHGVCEECMTELYPEMEETEKS